jgi:hypothetical protein
MEPPMIAPVPVFPPAPGAQPDTGQRQEEKGDPFAALLATLQAAVPPAPAVEEVAPVPGEIAAITDPAATLDPVTEPQLRPAARVFNRDGFFASFATVDAGGGEMRVTEALVQVPPLAVDIAQTPPAPLESAEPGIAPKASARPATPAAAHRRAAVRTPLAAPRPAIQTEIPTAARLLDEEQVQAPDPAGPTRSRRSGASRAAVQIALHEIENGLHVAALAQGLDEADRLRLHDEIAALLSRHGYAPRSIRVAAPAGRNILPGRVK